MADGYLTFDTKIDTKGFSKGVNSLNGQLSGLKSTVLKLGAAIAAAFSVKVLVNFGKQAVNIASDMQEVQNVVDTAFGEMSYKMEEFADTAIEMYGISKLTAKQTGSTFAAMGSGMGLALDNATDMAVALTALSADMASFYNVEQDAAATALKSVFTGETETLKQFGIVMTQTNLEAYALSQGITKSYQAMSEAEKVMLRYGFVLQSTALAQGDFAKTSSGWANQTRILSEQWKEFSSIIGNVLMGVLLPAVRALNGALSSLIAYAKGAAQALSSLFGIEIETGSSAAQIESSTSQAADSYKDMASSAEEAAEATERSLAGFDKVTKLSAPKTSAADESGVSSSFDVGTVGAITPGTATIKVDADTSPASKKLSELKKILATLVDPFVTAWNSKGNSVINSMKNAFNGIENLVLEIGKSLATVWTNGSGAEALEHILGIIEGKLNTIGNLSNNFASAWGKDNVGTNIFQSLANSLNSFLEHMENVQTGIADWAGKLDFSPLLNSMLELTTALEPLVDNVGTGLEWLYNEVLLPFGKWTIEEALSAAIDTLAQAFGALNEVIEALKPLAGWLWDNFLQPIASWTGGIVIDVLNGLGDVLERIGNWISDNQEAVEAITIAVGGFFAVWELTTIGEFIINAGGLIEIFKNLKNAIQGVTLAKIKDKVESLQIIALYAKDFAVSIAKNIVNLTKEAAAWAASTAAKVHDKIVLLQLTALYVKDVAVSIAKNIANLAKEAAAWAVSTAAKIANTAAQVAMTAATVIWNGVCTIATAVTTAFGAAVAFLTSPIGLVVVAIGALIAIGVALYKNWDEIKAQAELIWENIKEVLYTFFDFWKAGFNDIVEFCKQAWENIKSVFSTVGEWFSNVFKAAWNGIKAAFSSAKSFFSGIWTNIKNVFSNAGAWFKSIFTAAWNGIKAAFSSAVTFFKGIWTGIKNVFSNVAAWYKNIFTAAWNGIKSAFSAVGGFFQNVWTNIKKPFLSVADWFKNTFQKAWEGVKNVFSSGGKIFDGIKEGIADTFKTIVNGLIGGINKVIAVPFNAINKVLEKIKNISIAGVEPFKNKINLISVPQIPKLAQGAVIPPNNEFLAVLGDQKRGTNIETPLKTMIEAFKTAFSEMGGTSSSEPRVIKLYLDRKEFFSAMVEENRKNTRITGKNAFAY